MSLLDRCLCTWLACAFLCRLVTLLPRIGFNAGKLTIWCLPRSAGGSLADLRNKKHP